LGAGKFAERRSWIIILKMIESRAMSVGHNVKCTNRACIASLFEVECRGSEEGENTDSSLLRTEIRLVDGEFFQGVFEECLRTPNGSAEALRGRPAGSVRSEVLDVCEWDGEMVEIDCDWLKAR
jgi:hypothetical protein